MAVLLHTRALGSALLTLFLLGAGCVADVGAGGAAMDKAEDEVACADGEECPDDTLTEEPTVTCDEPAFQGDVRELAQLFSTMTPSFQARSGDDAEWQAVDVAEGPPVGAQSLAVVLSDEHGERVRMETTVFDEGGFTQENLNPQSVILDLFEYTEAGERRLVFHLETEEQQPIEGRTCGDPVHMQAMQSVAG